MIEPIIDTPQKTGEIRPEMAQWKMIMYDCFLDPQNEILLLPTSFQHDGAEPVCSVQKIQDGRHANVVHIMEKQNTIGWQKWIWKMHIYAYG